MKQFGSSRLKQLGIVALLIGVGLLAVWQLEKRQPREGFAALETQSEVASEEPVDISWLIAPGQQVTEEERARLERKAKKKKKPYDKPDDAQRYFLEQRTGGAPIDYSVLAEQKAYAATIPKTPFDGEGFRPDLEPSNVSNRASGDITNWEELGPGNIGGRTRAILQNPTTPSIMYAGGVAGGVWYTSDSGANWNPLDDLMDNLAITTLAFAGQGGGSVNTSIIYAGTGEGFFNGDAVRGAGIFKTTDAGTTWSQLSSTNTSNFQYVNKIVASPNNVNVLYAATRTGVWKTTDAGANWSIVLNDNGLGGTNGTVTNTSVGITDIEIRTDLGTDSLIASNGSFTTDGIYLTTDAGATWSRVHTATNMGRNDLAIAPSDQTVMYALSTDRVNSYRTLQVYRSTDGGATWSARLPGTYDGSTSWKVMERQGWYDNIIAVAPHDPDVVFGGAVDVYRSDDGGASWGQIAWWWLDPTDSRYAHADQHMMVFDPGWNGTTNQTLIVGNDGGMQRTTNALAAKSTNGVTTNSSVSWSVINNSYGVTQFYQGRPMPDGTEGYFGGTQDNGTIYGDDASGINGWTEILGGDGGYVSYSSGATALFAEYQNLAINRSTNGGVSFGSIVNNLSSGSGFSFIVPYRIDPSNDDIIWIGGSAAWRSTNATSSVLTSGVTWVQASTTQGSNSSAFAIDPNDSDNVWRGAGSALWHTDSGTTATSATAWTNVTPSGMGFVSSVEVDGNDATGNTIYCTSSYYSSSTVFRSTDRGATWTNISNNLPSIPAHTIVVQPGYPANLFVGTELGVYASGDTGATWTNMNDPGFSNTVVEHLEFQNLTTLYAFTHGRGCFRATVEADALSVSGTPLDSTGEVGGPFSPTCETYTLDNVGESGLNWTATKTTSWLSLSGTSGFIAAGNSTTVDACLTGDADSLPGGIHTDTITFTNISTGSETLIGVTLFVDATQTIVSYDLSSDPGWATSGAWEFGVPLGLGGDPTAGATGSNVYGYNLAGAYTNLLGEETLTTDSIDCSTFVNVTLNFQRWLGVESSIYDNARVDVRANGGAWTTVWQHSGSSFQEASWSPQEIDISSVADYASDVQVRWVMGTTDSSVTYSGWNIDDIELTGTQVTLSEAWVDFAYSGSSDGTSTNPFPTVAQGVAALIDDGSGIVKIKGDTADSDSHETPTISKAMQIRAINGSVTIGAPAP